MFNGFFFDMDGVLFDSMPNHAAAWEEVMSKHGLHFTAHDCYLQEGRTGQDVIHEAILNIEHREATENEILAIYKEKTDAFHRRGGATPMQGITQVLDYIHTHLPNAQQWIVTGSGQHSLFDTLEQCFPAIFTRQHMITAFDVVHGKPNPEPYLKAWERSGLKKEECCVIENAPLGIRAAKQAGLFTIGVNTGILARQDLWRAGADLVLDDMHQLYTFLLLKTHIENHILPYYDTFDHGHDRKHAESVINESFNLVSQLECADKAQSINCLMVYAIAAYHDLGLCINREHHHLNSGYYIRQDSALAQWFDSDQIETMAQAAEDHRASRKQPPRSLYGCIISEADRCIDPITILRRTVQFSLRHYPDFTKEQHLMRAYDHMIEKYSETGYLKLWMHSERNTKGLNDLRNIIHNKTELISICSRLYDEETANG